MVWKGCCSCFYGYMGFVLLVTVRSIPAVLIALFLQLPLKPIHCLHLLTIVPELDNYCHASDIVSILSDLSKVACVSLLVLDDSCRKS